MNISINELKDLVENINTMNEVGEVIKELIEHKKDDISRFKNIKNTNNERIEFYSEEIEKYEKADAISILYNCVRTEEQKKDYEGYINSRKSSNILYNKKIRNAEERIEQLKELYDKFNNMDIVKFSSEVYELNNE